MSIGSDLTIEVESVKNQVQFKNRIKSECATCSGNKCEEMRQI